MLMGKVRKWDQSSIDNMNKIVQLTITLSFEQVLKIEDHIFGTLELHHKGTTRSFGEILANEIKVALIEADLKRFQKGKTITTKQNVFLNFHPMTFSL